MINREKLLISELKDFAKEYNLVFEVVEEVHPWLSLYFRKANKGYGRRISYNEIYSIEFIEPYIKYIKLDVLEKLNIKRGEIDEG